MKIKATLLDQIRKHGEATYPEECCGLLLGRSGPDGNHVLALYPVENRHAEQRERRYTIAPSDYLAAERAARQQGLDVVGFYHSHPDHPARPSATDLAEATFPGYTYVIVAVHQGRAGELTAWHLSPDRTRFEPEAIEIELETTSVDQT